MRRAPLIVTLVAGLTLTACGIPDNTEVQPLRPGPSTGVSSGGDATPARNLRTDTFERSQFVRNYLEAAAGDFEGATERVKQFLSPSAAATFKASPEIKVVRLPEEPLIEPGRPDVTIKAQQVGTLGSDGVLVPGTGDTATYRLELRELDGQQGLFVTDAPPALLLSVEALNTFYTQRTIYFWNRDRTGLVPDLRYMSRSVPFEQQPTEIMDWLTGGPSPLVAGVVEALPEGTKVIGNVPAVTNDTLQISLSGEVLPPDDAAGALERLQKQLRWSLRPLPGALELTIERQASRRYVGNDYLASNAGYRQITEPERFVVYAGQVRRVARSYNADQPVPVIAPEANKNVRMAALSSSGSRSWAALVVNESRGKRVLRVGAAGLGEHAALRRIVLPAPIGRPVWAKSPVGADGGTAGLVTAGGKLWTFSAEGTSVQQVKWTGAPRGGISAVAVAPDAHRVAVLAGGQLYVAALSSNEDGPQLLSARIVRTELSDLSAVDWSSETLLAVAGRRPDTSRVAIIDVSIDGATQTRRLSDLGSSPVDYLAALPASATSGGATSGAIAYVQGGAAYDEVNDDRIGVDDLAEPVSNPPQGVLPDAPFFLT